MKDKTVDAYQSLFQSRAGEMVLADLRAEFYDKRLIAPEVTQMAVNAGQHNVIRYILDMLEVDNG